jgi:signal transduction histidine kinase
MNWIEYLYEKLTIIFINLFSALTLSVFLKLMGLPNNALIIILICWFFIITLTLLFEYIKLNHKYNKINHELEKLDKKYLIAELFETPDSQIEKIYNKTLKAAAKSMIEEAGQTREGLLFYKEYIERWIHEIKTPIAAIDFICQNHTTEETTRIDKELQRINYLVEQALYYARSEIVEKDYFVKHVRLFDVVQHTLLNNRSALLEQHFKLNIEETEDQIWTDEKWLNYILGQILSNAIKYRNSKEPKLHIYSRCTDNGIRLFIEDNGIGISEAELPRIFEKGFTGNNRSNSKSTGIGLYLCKKLCDKLGLIITAESEEGCYTRIILFFPVGKLTSDCME